MRISVDIDEAEIARLDRLAERNKISRASIIRQAIKDYLPNRKTVQEIDAFGLWLQAPVDQEKLREEW